METGKKQGFLGQKQFIIPENILERIESNSLINNLYITHLGYYPKAAHHHRKRKNGTKEYILIYCIEGVGWIKYDNNNFQITPNTFFIIPPDTSHSYGADVKEPWSIYWIHFKGKSANKLYERFLFTNSPTNPKPKVNQISYREPRIQLFKELISKTGLGYGMLNVEYININLWRLLSSFIYRDMYSETTQKNLTTDIIDLAITHMKSNLNRSLSVEEIANELNYSTSHLYSIFKNQTGYSPIQYFNHLKIQKACQYLSFTGLSIKEISYKLGFNDPFYFSRLFKNLMKLSPSEYRLNNKS